MLFSFIVYYKQTHYGVQNLSYTEITLLEEHQPMRSMWIHVRWHTGESLVAEIYVHTRIIFVNTNLSSYVGSEKFLKILNYCLPKVYSLFGVGMFVGKKKRVEEKKKKKKNHIIRDGRAGGGEKETEIRQR